MTNQVKNAEKLSVQNHTGSFSCEVVLNVYRRTSDWVDDRLVITSEDYDSSEYIFLCTTEVLNLELGSTDDIAERVAKLQAKRDDILAEAAAEAKRINDAIEQLVAIEYQPDPLDLEPVAEVPPLDPDLTQYEQGVKDCRDGIPARPEFDDEQDYQLGYSHQYHQEQAEAAAAAQIPE